MISRLPFGPFRSRIFDLGRLNNVRTNFKRFAATHDHNEHNDHEEYNEPGGILFGKDGPNGKYEIQRITWVFIFGYCGGIGLFLWLLQYRPDNYSIHWARREAIKRMAARNVDLRLASLTPREWEVVKAIRKRYLTKDSPPSYCMMDSNLFGPEDEYQPSDEELRKEALEDLRASIAL